MIVKSNIVSSILTTKQQYSRNSKYICYTLWLKEQTGNRRPLMDRAPNMAGRNCGVSSLLTEEVKDKTNRDLILSHL
jgi:hypothetical protein